ncbi:hypothetical protein H0H93_012344, partial [Arthromyces matolae]
NLETHAGGFPPGEIETKGEVVVLTESASTLENLFQYVYPQRHPDIELLPFLELSNLAEAAEKYEVFGVITICKTRIKHFVTDHPSDIFNYAYKHGYTDILSMAAPLLLDLQFSTFAQSFPAELMNPWARYREQWTRAAFAIIYTIGKCNNCRSRKSNSTKQVEAARICFEIGERRTRESIASLIKQNVPTRMDECRTCHAKMDTTKEKVLESLDKAVDAVSLFHTFL